MRTHAAYLDISAPTHAAFGEQLGKRLADLAAHDAAALQARPDYADLKLRAEPYLDSARETHPQLVDQVTGYARGAGIAFEDAWLLSLEDELVPNERCTTVLTNGGKLLGHNEDWDVADAAERLFVLRRKIGAEETLELYYRNTLGGNACGVNGRGLVFAVNSPPGEDTRAGLPRNFTARDAADAPNADEAVDRATCDHRASGFGYLFVDAEGTVSAVETTATDASVTAPTLPHCHTNHLLDAKLNQPGSKYSQARLAAAQRAVRGQMPEAALELVLANKVGWPDSSLFNQNTVGRVIADLDKRVFRVWLKREADAGWIDYPFPKR